MAGVGEPSTQSSSRREKRAAPAAESAAPGEPFVSLPRPQERIARQRRGAGCVTSRQGWMAAASSSDESGAENQPTAQMLTEQTQKGLWESKHTPAAEALPLEGR